MASSFEDLVDTPQIQFDSFLGFSGHLSRSIQVLPSGTEIVYPSGAQLAFLQIQEKVNQQQAQKSPQNLRRVGGGYAAPRPRAFGGQTSNPNGSLVVTKASKPLLEQQDKLEVPEQMDTNVIQPGSLIRPALVSGHSQNISAVCSSKSGKLVISGTSAPSGKLAEVIVWDAIEKRALCLINQHKGSIADIAISPDETYFATLGEDNLVVFYPLSSKYNFELYKPLAGRQFQVSCNLHSLCIVDENIVVVGGDDYLNFLTFDGLKRTIFDNQVRIQLRRRFNCFCVVDGFLYTGTEQGDVIKIDPVKQLAVSACPSKKPFPGAVTSICANDQGNLIVSTTASNIYMIRTDTMMPVAQNQVPADTLVGCASAAYSSSQLNSATASAMSMENHLHDAIKIPVVNAFQNGITSLATSPSCPYVYAMGPNCLARVSKTSLEVRLLQTAPPAVVSPYGVVGIATPRDFARIFVVACGQFLSCYSAATGGEMIRITVPNTRVLCALVLADGSQIISGWSDGCIRAHGPSSGKILWIINSAHEGGVYSIMQSYDGSFICTGGEDKKVCLFRTDNQQLQDVHQGHRGKVVAMSHVLQDDGEEQFTSGCDMGYVQSFRLVATKSTAGLSGKLQALWNARTEGSCRGLWQLRDGSQVLAVGSGGMIWFQCGTNGGSILRALPLPEPASCCCAEEQGEAAKIVVGTVGGWIFQVDWDTGLIEKKLQVHGSEVMSCAACEGAAFVGGKDGCVVIFGIWE